MIPYFLNPFGVSSSGGGESPDVRSGILVMRHSNPEGGALSLHLLTVQAKGNWYITADQTYEYSGNQSDIFIEPGFWTGTIRLEGKISKFQFGSYSRFDQLEIQSIDLELVDLTETFAGLGDGNGAGLTGGVYDLWNDSNYNTLPHSGCFRNCTGFSNYSDIPEDWK